MNKSNKKMKAIILCKLYFHLKTNFNEILQSKRERAFINYKKYLINK